LTHRCNRIRQNAACYHRNTTGEPYQIVRSQHRHRQYAQCNYEMHTVNNISLALCGQVISLSLLVNTKPVRLKDIFDNYHGSAYYEATSVRTRLYAKSSRCSCGKRPSRNATHYAASDRTSMKYYVTTTMCRPSSRRLHPSPPYPCTGSVTPTPTTNTGRARYHIASAWTLRVRSAGRHHGLKGTTRFALACFFS
jgi:hypothetical protein